jgi:hypothetical protein
MKKSSFAAVLLAFSILSGLGQGMVHFGNTPTTLITTNDFQSHIGNILGAGNYSFSLYAGPFGSSSESLALIIPRATNGAVAGRFDGGIGTLPGFVAGTQLSFQVRGWSSFAGATYEEAYNYAVGNGVPTAFLGQSTLGFFTVPSSGTIELFGAGPGQVGGFALTPVVPEPSTWALAVLGSLLGAAWLRRRR